jgi:hypothetical protein
LPPTLEVCLEDFARARAGKKKPGEAGGSKAAGGEVAFDFFTRYQ